MKIRSVLLPVVLSFSLIACDSESVVQVLSVGEESGNSDTTGDSDAGGDTDTGTNPDAGDNGTTDSTDTDGNSETSDNSGNSNNENLDPDRQVSLVGLVKVEPVNTESDFSRGLFTRMNNSLTAQNILEYFVPATDFCEVTRYNAAFPPGGAFKIYGQQPELISAGESITLTSSQGTYATLERQIVEGTGLIYKSNTELSTSIPSDLVLDVPGEVFPGFSNVALSSVPALQVTAPAATMTENSDFVWNANSDPLSVFEIYAGYTSPETNQVTFVGCTVPDDGQFAFDAATRAELGEGFTADWFAFLRVVYDVAESEDAMVFVANSVNPQ